MTQRYHSTHEDLAMLPANDGVYVLFCDYEALRTELAQCQQRQHMSDLNYDALEKQFIQCQQKLDEARMFLDNRQQEVDRLILEQSHTYAVEIPELEQHLAQAQRGVWSGLQVTNEQLTQALTELGNSRTKAEAYVEAAVRYVIACRERTKE